MDANEIVVHEVKRHRVPAWLCSLLGITYVAAVIFSSGTGVTPTNAQTASTKSFADRDSV
jgi:molybdopterin biosynthesis enzyme MoaB